MKPSREVRDYDPECSSSCYIFEKAKKMTSLLFNNPSARVAMDTLRKATTAPGPSTGQAGNTQQIGTARPDESAYWSTRGTESADGADELAGALAGVAASRPGRLVETDIDEEGAKLKAGQAQQMLAVRQMSIANAGAGPSILQMFR
jgi:hypothetical protein